MSETVPLIDVHSIIYTRDGAVVNEDDITDYEGIEIQKLNEAGELQYSEKRDDDTLILEAVAFDGDFKAKADAVYEHAIDKRLKDGADVQKVEVSVYIPAEDFELTISAEEDEQFVVKAVFKNFEEEEDGYTPTDFIIDDEKGQIVDSEMISHMQ